MIKIKQKAAEIAGGTYPPYDGSIHTVDASTQSELIIPKEETVSQDPKYYVSYSGHTQTYPTTLTRGTTTDLGEYHNYRYFNLPTNTGTYTLTAPVTNLDLGENNTYRYITTSNMRVPPTGTTYQAAYQTVTQAMGNNRYLVYNSVPACGPTVGSTSSTWARTGSWSNRRGTGQNTQLAATWSPAAESADFDGWNMLVLSMATGATAWPIGTWADGISITAGGYNLPLYRLKIIRSDNKYSFALVYGWYYAVKGTSVTTTVNSSYTQTSATGFVKKLNHLYVNSAPFYFEICGPIYYANAGGDGTAGLNMPCLLYDTGARGQYAAIYLSRTNGGNADLDRLWIYRTITSYPNITEIDMKSKASGYPFLPTISNSSGTVQHSVIGYINTFMGYPVNNTGQSGEGYEYWYGMKNATRTGDNCSCLFLARIRGANQAIM